MINVIKPEMIGFINFDENKFKFISIRFSKYLKVLSTIKANDVAIAAPTIPYIKISKKFKHDKTIKWEYN